MEHWLVIWRGPAIGNSILGLIGSQNQALSPDMVKVLQDAALLADSIKGGMKYVLLGAMKALIVSPFLAAQLLDGFRRSAGSSSPLHHIAELLSFFNQPLDQSITAIGQWSEELASYILQHAGDIYQVAIGVPLLKTVLVPSQWGKTEYYLLFEVEQYWGSFLLAHSSHCMLHHVWGPFTLHGCSMQCPGSPGGHPAMLLSRRPRAPCPFWLHSSSAERTSTCVSG